MLRTIEQRIESIVERTFGRAFRSRLQPVELARKLAREMEHHKTVSVSRVYVPNEFTVYLSPSDREEFSSYEASLTSELGSYLSQHAKAEGLSLVSDPAVVFETDEDLRIGEFGIACRMAEAPDPDEPSMRPAVPAAPHGTPIRTAPAPDLDAPGIPAPGVAGAAAGVAGAGVSAGSGAPAPVSATDLKDDDPEPPEPAPEAPPAPAQPTRIHEGLAAVSGTQMFNADQAAVEGVPRETLTLVTPGGRRRVTKRVTRLGRSRDCDVVVDDQNVSRRHAEIRHVGIEYVIVDLDSTNGVEVNGDLVTRHALADGDEVMLGATTLRVELS
ncbi:MAG: FHA domain-containing protein [Thermoleophilia bacterium]|nr:FHA domain-containing protein [Thermoleophilia bacterium]MDH3724445.1 FHA domain-containing protein [Thermoleophilia bacterium]